MVRLARSLALIALLPAVFESSASAQTKEVWPEAGLYVTLTEQSRLYFIATRSAERGEATSSEFGPNLDMYVQPIRARKHWIGFRLDESKNRLLHIRAGYRYLPAFNGDSDENRGVLEGTARFPLIIGVLVSIRNRMDFRFIDGEYSWRFRNRLSAEKEFSIRRVTLNPYLRAEVFYDSRFHEWSRTEATAGAAFPIDHRWEAEGYLVYQNDTGNSPNRQVYALGLVLNLYFRKP